ncbi:MAG: Asp23/Gls24 family envelope stress response protein [Sumerlaeia bacterium]
MSVKQKDQDEKEEVVQSTSIIDLDEHEEEGELIQISDDVITHIVELAGREIQGVSLIESKSSFSELRNFISKGKFINRKGEEPRRISVERGAKKGDVKIQVSVEMEYGKDMYELAVRLRNHIKDAVEKMTRVTVKKVDIAIVGIRQKEEMENVDEDLLAE